MTSPYNDSRHGMKKALIISYYWPPSAGAGVQRWLKFSKYLREFGWEPVVYVPEGAEYQHEDPSLQADVPPGMQMLKTRIREPYRLYKLITGKSGREKVQPGFLSEQRSAGLAEGFATWIRGNFFIPDARRSWIRPSIKFLSNWLMENRIDAMISTGPPHSMHLIALGLKKQFNIPWLADFRDPWTQIDFYHKLRLTRLADKKHRRLERQVLLSADRVVTVSDNCGAGLQEISGRPVDVVTNGYDPDDFREIPSYDHQKFSLTHLGLMNADRNPVALWDALASLVADVEGFSGHLEVKLIGKTDFRVGESLRSRHLDPYVNDLNYLPHDRALAEAGNSAILLLPLNNTPNVRGIAPGKLYEYLALQRPILCIGPPDGDVAAILEETGSGFTAGFGETEKIRTRLEEWYRRFRQQGLQRLETNAGKYARPALTGRLAAILDEILTE